LGKGRRAEEGREQVACLAQSSGAGHSALKICKWGKAAKRANESQEHQDLRADPDGTKRREEKRREEKRREEKRREEKRREEKRREEKRREEKRREEKRREEKRREEKRREEKRREDGA
jgi:hypothetical protein